MNEEQHDNLLIEQRDYLRNISGWVTFGGIITFLAIAINILDALMMFW